MIFFSNTRERAEEEKFLSVADVSQAVKECACAS